MSKQEEVLIKDGDERDGVLAELNECYLMDELNMAKIFATSSQNDKVKLANLLRAYLERAQERIEEGGEKG